MKYFPVLGLLLTAAVNLTTAADYNEAIKEINEAFPDLVIGSPQILEVVFDNGAFLDLGKNITATESQNQPFVGWYAEKNTFYTLMVVNPDGPSVEDPYLKDIIAWMRVNIPEDNLHQGEDLIEYIGAATPKNKGFNRYFYFLFAQPGQIEFSGKRVARNQVAGRFYFQTRKFIKKYQLGSPVGVNYLTAYYDPQSVVVYKQVKCCQDLYT